MGTIYRTEGPFALFRGLGPNLAGYVPATALKFLLYGNTKTALVTLTGRENGWTHLGAGMVAGVVTCTATNPFWVIKTRLQLDLLRDPASGIRSRQYRNSLDCLGETVRKEGLRALYKGLSASYIGTLETAVQWTLYEHLKSSLRSDQERNGSVVQSAEEAISAGSSKLVAAVALYPHEVRQQHSPACLLLTYKQVLRTRLREAPRNGTSTYQTGLRECFRNIIAKEGFAALYGGLAAHLLRAVPSSAIVFTVYEATLRLFPQQTGLAT